MTAEKTCSISQALPKPFELPANRTALVIIDMQRDFVAPNGYGMYQCPSADTFARVSCIIDPLKSVLDMCRSRGMTVIHTREGHDPTLIDCHASKRLRQKQANPRRHQLCIGDEGPMGSLLVRGEYGHDIIDELKPLASETVLDKPAKGSFCNTEFYQILTAKGITHILLAGVTTECCVDTTFREANDRGFECCVLKDCTQGFNEQIVSATLKMFSAYDGLLGYTCTSAEFKEALSEYRKAPIPSGNAEKIYEALKNKTIELRSWDVVYQDLEKSKEDENCLSGQLFCTTSIINDNSTIFKTLLAKGAIWLGVVKDFQEFVPVDGLVLISTDTEGQSHANKNGLVFTPTYGTISTSGIKMECPSFDKFCILGSQMCLIRRVWAELTGFDMTDPYSRHSRCFPTPAIDYRGPLNELRIGLTEKSFLRMENMLKKIKPVYVKHVDERLFERTITLSGTLHDQERGILQNKEIKAENLIDARTASILRHELLQIKNQIISDFETGNIHALILPKQEMFFGVINALDLCAISSEKTSLMLVGGPGLDWKIADLAESLGW